MIEFQDIKYKNFLSVGDDFINVSLNKSPTTVIHGMNGSGKTTMMEALVYGLYGKPYRKVKLAKLINSINKKKMVVEVDFRKGGVDYRIRRGQKPALFEIYKGGYEQENLIPVDGSTAEYQKRVEEILGMDFKVFTQIVILNNERFIPFMELTTPDRRKVVEDLFDMAIFGDMKEILKQKRVKLKTAKDDFEHKLLVTNGHVATYKGIIDNANTQSDMQIQSKLNDIDLKERELVKFDEKLKQLEDNFTRQELTPLDRTRLDKINSLFSGIETNIRMAESIIRDGGKISDELQARKDENNRVLITSRTKLESFVFENFSSPELDSQMSGIKTKVATLVAEKSNLLAETDKCHACDRDFDDAEARKTHRDARIAEIETEVGSLNDELVSINDTKQAEFTNAKASLEVTVNEYQDEEARINSEVKQEQDDIKATAQAELDKNKDALNQLEEKRESAKLEISKIEQNNALINDINTEHDGLVRDIASDKKAISEVIKAYQNDIVKLKENNSNVDEEKQKLADYEAEAKQHQLGLDKLEGVVQVFDVTEKLLADDAIKSNIVLQYIPIINDKLNKLLVDMNLPVGFILDENFDETIMASSKDGFVYESFSGGQKCRINLAIVLVWIEIAKMKNSVNTNLLFMDEIFDGTMDEEGIDDFMRLVGLNYSHLNMFVITQRAEMMMDKFRSSIKFKLNNGFTEMV